MAYPECGSERPVPPYDNLRAVDWTRLLAEKSQRLDQLFLENIRPFVDARIRLLEYYGRPQITVGPSGMKVLTILPAEVQALDDRLVEAIEWLRERFNHPANAQISGGTPSAESDCSTEYPHYHADCPKCGKRTVWRDPREYGDTIGCMRCGHEIELSNPTGLGTTHKTEERT